MGSITIPVAIGAGEAAADAGAAGLAAGAADLGAGAALGGVAGYKWGERVVIKKEQYKNQNGIRVKKMILRLF